MRSFTSNSFDQADRRLCSNDMAMDQHWSDFPQPAITLAIT
jgi:hypothetical protein